MLSGFLCVVLLVRMGVFWQGYINYLVFNFLFLNNLRLRLNYTAGG